MKRLLEGIKIVELGTHVAVPNATRMLADWGAEVIKVEGFVGDLWRYVGTNVQCPTREDENPIFTVQNSNKKIVSINLKDPKGVELLLELLDGAAAFISNVRYQSLTKLGLDYDSLKERFPSLVYFHFTGYGYEGPMAKFPGFDAAAYWSAGGMLLDWTPKGSTSVQPALSYGDATVSSSVLSGLLAALLHRERTGEGQRVTTSLYANAIWYNYADVIATQPQYGLQRPAAYEDVANPFMTCYECADGEWLLVCILEFDRAWRGALPLLGLGEYAEDERYNTLSGYAEHRAKLFPKLCEAFRRKTANEWQAIFLGADFVSMRMARASEIYKSEQAWANGYLQEVEFQNGHKAALPSTPIRFFGAEAKPYQTVGGVGCHSVEVLSTLGYTREQIETFKQDGIVKY